MSFKLNTTSYNETPLRRSYTIGYMKNVFSEVDINDARAAIKVLVNGISRNFQYADGYNLKAKIYNDYDEVSKSMREDSLAVLAMNSFDYLNNCDKIGLDPVLVPRTKGDVFEQYDILVRKEDHYKYIKDLKGTNIGLLSSNNHIASRLWLDISLSKINITDKSKFFKNITMVNKESQLILDLFFNRLDACVVSEGELELMKELNPQIGNKLISIQCSPKYLWGVACFAKIFTNEKDRDIFYKSIFQLNGLNTGKQLFSLVRINKLEPFKYEYLNSYKDLIKEYSYYIKTKKIKYNEFN
jgi:phosphonate transport system substrate-binding protein